MNNNDIAIIGMACRFPGDANTPFKYWENILNKKDCIINPPQERRNLMNSNGGYKCGYISSIDMFDTQLFKISPKEAEKMDPQQRILLMVAFDAFDSTGNAISKIFGGNCGVFIGISSHDYSYIVKNCLNETDLYTSAGNASSIAANRLSYYFNLTGPSVAIDTACSSSLVAVHSACNSIKNGECTTALAGGVNLILLDEITSAFKTANMLSKDYKCKTFDESADGYVRGEGCGIIILKKFINAIHDNDNIFAIIKGGAVNQDGKSNGLTAPNGLAQKRVIFAALEASAIKPNQVSYIELHGTGTKLGDPVEVNALSEIYSRDRTIDNPCYLGSVKTNIGHLEAAAGIAGIIKTAIMLQEDKIPPILNFNSLNPYIKIDYDILKISTEDQIKLKSNKLEYAAVSSFGFGGTNTHMILQRYENQSDLKIPNKNHAYDCKSYWIKDISLDTRSGVDHIEQDQYDNNNLNDMEILSEGAIKNTILNSLSKITAYPKSEINMNFSLINTLGFDSLMAISLVTDITHNYPVLKEKAVNILASLQNEDLTVSNIIKETAKVLSEYYTIDYEEDAKIIEKNDVPGDLPKKAYVFTETDEYKRFRDRKNLAGDSNPYFKLNTGVARDLIHLDGSPYINFTTYNYVGLNGAREVKQAVVSAVNKYGTSVSGSRLLSGEIPLHRELEQQISQFLGTEDTIVYVGGHGTNLSTIGHMVSDGDLIVHDNLSHNSIIEGCMLSGATRRSFAHNDMESLDKILSISRNQFNKVLIIVEGIYSMDGDICKLPELIEIKKKFKAFLMVDEAHSIGTIGDCGRGVGDYFKVDRKDVDLWMGTLSKSFASCGGYISGQKDLIEYLKYTSPGFIFSCGITPSNAAAALEAIRQLLKKPSLIDKLKSNSCLFLELVKKAGFDTGTSKNTPIVPIMLKDSDFTMKLTSRLLEKKINVMPIIYPAVPEDMARLRFFISSLHTEKQIRYTIDILKSEYSKLATADPATALSQLLET